MLVCNVWMIFINLFIDILFRDYFCYINVIILIEFVVIEYIFN